VIAQNYEAIKNTAHSSNTKKNKKRFASTCMRYGAGWLRGCESENLFIYLLCIRKQERPFSFWS